jgi:hypothetical protein
MATKKRTTKQSATRTSNRTNKRTRKPAATKAATAKSKAKSVPTEQEQPKRSPRWSIGVFRNAKGNLVTVYVSADGTPMPYEAKRVGDAKILHHAVYAGMKYSEARQELLKDAATAGVK